MANNVLINTTYGPFTVELYPEKAPVTVANFLNYVDSSFYDLTIFHRVIDNFMIQGGGMSETFATKMTASPIVLESNNGLANLRGTIAMARTSAPDSATSQFFVNTVDNTSLNYQSSRSPGYAVFGKVIDGMDVVDLISDTRVATVSISGATYQNFPYPSLVTIFSAERYNLADTLTPTSHSKTTNPFGVTIATYDGSRADYGIRITNASTATVTQIDGKHTGESLQDIDRLHFGDRKLAIDLGTDGNAGQALELIGVLAPSQLNNTSIRGLIINLLDQGQTLQGLSQLALDLNLLPKDSNASLASAVYRNALGADPSQDMNNTLVAYIAQNGQANFVAAVAGLHLNVDLVGLQKTGIEYVI